MFKCHLVPDLIGICKYYRITLIEKGSVVLGNPDASELYTRLITTETAKRMPLEQPQLNLPTQLIDTIGEINGYE